MSLQLLHHHTIPTQPCPKPLENSIQAENERTDLYLKLKSTATTAAANA